MAPLRKSALAGDAQLIACVSMWVADAAYLAWRLSEGGAASLDGGAAAAAGLAVYLAVVAAQNWRTAADEPPLRFSWVPLLGSAIELGGDALGFFRRCARYGEVVKAHVAGRTMYLVTNPTMYAQVFKRPRELSFKAVGDEVMRGAFQVSDAALAGLDDAAVHRLYVRHLKGTEGLRGLTLRVQGALDRAAKAALAPRIVATAAHEWCQGDLYSTVSEVLFHATVEAVFGAGAARAPVLEAFRAFDGRFPLLAGGVPLSLFGGARRGLEAQRALFRGDYWAEASAFIRDRHALFQQTLGREDEARVQAVMIWAAVANTVPAAFWTLYFVLRAPGLKDRVLAEVADALEGRGSRGEDIGQEVVGSLRLLDGCVDEALRLASGSMVVRVVEKDLVLEGEAGAAYKLRKGSRLAFYPAQMHLDAAVYDRPNAFDADRFSGGRGDATLRGRRLPAPLMPFGGGVSMCPGRAFARNDVKLFVAKMLLNYDLRLPAAAEGPAGIDAPDFPGFDVSRAGLGIYPPVAAVPYEVRARRPLRMWS